MRDAELAEDRVWDRFAEPAAERYAEARRRAPEWRAGIRALAANVEELCRQAAELLERAAPRSGVRAVAAWLDPIEGTGGYGLAAIPQRLTPVVDPGELAPVLKAKAAEGEAAFLAAPVVGARPTSPQESPA